MKLLGNILWLIFGGLISALSWFAVGCLWCITLIGIPVGIQCFKFAQLCLSPFSSEVIQTGGVGSCLLNILWLIFGGLELACVSFILGVALCLTLIGIPFGLQQFKLAKLALMPFGAEIVPKS